MRIETISWPLDRLGEGLEALARAAGLLQRKAQFAAARLGLQEVPQTVPQEVQTGAVSEMERWLEWASAGLGLEAESVDVPVPQFDSVLHQAGPAVLHVHHPEFGRRCVLLLSGRGGKLRVLGADLRVHRCEAEALRALVCAAFEQPLLPGIEQLLNAAEVPARKRPAVRRLMLAERLATQRVGGCWVLRQGAAHSFRAQLMHARLPQRLGAILFLFAAIYALEIGGWKLIGEAALNGHLDLGWLTAWVLLLLAMVPLRVLSGWLDASFSLQAGTLLKQRLLAGALRLDLDRVRHLGAGQLLGRVMESQALEGLALSGGVGVVVATLELAFAAWILASGAAAALHLALLAAWLLVAGTCTARYVRELRRWTQQRLDMTNDIVERMVGHRTSLAQEQPQRRDTGDDQLMASYLQASRDMDAAVAPVVSLAPGGWIVVALAGLAPAFAANSATPAALAISLGGILFAHRALGGISNGLSSLARAALAWGRVGEIFKAGASEKAAAQAPYIAHEQLRRAWSNESHAAPLVNAQGLNFGYGHAPVLRGANLEIGRGDRVLLQGPSGGGKSTLAALLVGLRQPAQGLLLLNGLDRHTLGDSWHALATEAPQFHDNHVLTGTLGFNLLMGRNWPATEAQLQEAQTLCEELGLGPLLARMPAGLQQRIGETGWQLSHGERSRLFLARALLQKAPLTVLDESFAALDPATLQRCLETALRHARALVVIAHP